MNTGSNSLKLAAPLHYIQHVLHGLRVAASCSDTHTNIGVRCGGWGGQGLQLRRVGKGGGGRGHIFKEGAPKRKVLSLRPSSSSSCSARVTHCHQHQQHDLHPPLTSAPMPTVPSSSLESANMNGLSPADAELAVTLADDVPPPSHVNDSGCSSRDCAAPPPQLTPPTTCATPPPPHCPTVSGAACARAKDQGCWRRPQRTRQGSRRTDPWRLRSASCC